MNVEVVTEEGAPGATGGAAGGAVSTGAAVEGMGELRFLDDRLRQAAMDRWRLGGTVVAALVVHLLLLLAPLPEVGDKPEVRPRTAGTEPFRLQEVRFAPPRVVPVPVPAPAPEPERLPEPVPVEASLLRPVPEADPEPPSRPPATARVLLPTAAAGSLVPPQPLSTPPPDYPEALWERGVHGEVLLTLVVDPNGQVVEVTVEEGPEPLGELAAVTARTWLFLPASLSGNPITAALQVRVRFPEQEAPPPTAPQPIEPPTPPPPGDLPQTDSPTSGRLHPRVRPALQDPALRDASLRSAPQHLSDSETDKP